MSNIYLWIYLITKDTLEDYLQINVKGGKTTIWASIVVFFKKYCVDLRDICNKIYVESFLQANLNKKRIDKAYQKEYNTLRKIHIFLMALSRVAEGLAL